jgi:hypothetical protein
MVEATQSYRERMKAARAKRQAAKAEWVRSVELMATARMMALDAVKRTIRGRETALHITRMLSWESRQTRCWDIAVCAGVYTRPKQREAVVSKEMRLTVPATLTVHLLCRPSALVGQNGLIV